MASAIQSMPALLLLLLRFANAKFSLFPKVLGGNRNLSQDLLIGQSLVDSIVLGRTSSLHLLALFRLHPHGRHTRIGIHLLLRQLTKQWVRPTVTDVPLMQLFHVGDAIQTSGSGFEKVGVFRQETVRHDAAGMVLPLKVWIGEACFVKK